MAVDSFLCLLDRAQREFVMDSHLFWDAARLMAKTKKADESATAVVVAAATAGQSTVS
jgi:hypothetical protein